MEEKLIEELKNLTEAINKNTVPLWISIVGVIVPIILSVAVIVQAWVQHRQNEKLQSLLSNRDIKAQMHSDFLKIYDDFCIAQNTLAKAEKDLIMIFSHPLMERQWTDELVKSNNLICQAVNRAKLLLSDQEDDKKLKDTLENVYKKYSDLTKKIVPYCIKGDSEKNRMSAWNSIVPEFGISPNSYEFLNINLYAQEKFVKLCRNDILDGFQAEIEQLLSCFVYEKFDVFFEKYLRIDEEEGEN